MVAYPDCEKCKQLKETAEYDEKACRSYRPDFGTPTPKAKWSKERKTGLQRLQEAAELSRAYYELHLGEDHGDETYKNNIPKLMTIILRKGR